MDKIKEIINKILGRPSGSDSSSSGSSGFTLIELLVVIAVIGVLAAGLLIAINPLEQIRRAQDSSIKTQTASIGRAVEAYYVNSASGTVPDYPDGTDWLSVDLGGEFKSTPKGNVALNACGAGATYESGFCLITTLASAANPSFVVYTTLNNKADRDRARAAGGTPGCTTPANTYYVYSSLVGKAGIYCGTPTALNITASTTLY